MEMLALPKDLLWNGKVEPTSPPTSELFPLIECIEEYLIDDDNFKTDLLLPTDCNILEFKTGLESTSSKICNNTNDLIIEFYDIKEEQWTDTKNNSSQYLDFNSFGTIVEQPALITKLQNSYDLNDNKATGYDATILTQLTPPQSPPQVTSNLTNNSVAFQDASNVKEILDFIVQQSSDSSIVSTENVNSSQAMLDYSNWNTSNLVPFQSEIDRETQIVDEIVKSRAKELLDWNDDCDESMSSISPPSTDEEWIPTSPSNISSSNESPEYVNNNHCENARKSTSSVQQILSNKRTRPYGRCPEDRKSRKKEQNKNAATRYRQKKKQEMENVFGEEQILSQQNDELKKILADRKREAKYLRTLIKEFYQKHKSK